MTFAVLSLAVIGSNVNHKPKADQKGVSFDRLRILYDIVIVRASLDVASSDGMKGGEDSCIRVRNSGAKSSGKYTLMHK